MRSAGNHHRDAKANLTRGTWGQISEPQEIKKAKGPSLGENTGVAWLNTSRADSGISGY